MSTGLSFGNRARISSIVLYLAMYRAVADETDWPDRGRLRSSETNADDGDNEAAIHSKETAKVVFIFSKFCESELSRWLRVGGP